MRCHCCHQSSWLPRCHFVFVVPVFLSSSTSWLSCHRPPSSCSAPLLFGCGTFRCHAPLFCCRALSSYVGVGLFDWHLPLPLVVLPVLVVSVWWAVGFDKVWWAMLAVAKYRLSTSLSGMASILLMSCIVDSEYILLMTFYLVLLK
jgi:hypothetical protein